MNIPCNPAIPLLGVYIPNWNVYICSPKATYQKVQLPHNEPQTGNNSNVHPQLKGRPGHGVIQQWEWTRGNSTAHQGYISETQSRTQEGRCNSLYTGYSIYIQFWKSKNNLLCWKSERLLLWGCVPWVVGALQNAGNLVCHNPVTGCACFVKIHGALHFCLCFIFLYVCSSSMTCTKGKEGERKGSLGSTAGWEIHGLWRSGFSSDSATY